MKKKDKRTCYTCHKLGQNNCPIHCPTPPVWPSDWQQRDITRVDHPIYSRHQPAHELAPLPSSTPQGKHGCTLVVPGDLTSEVSSLFELLARCHSVDTLRSGEESFLSYNVEYAEPLEITIRRVPGGYSELVSSEARRIKLAAEEAAEKRADAWRNS